MKIKELRELTGLSQKEFADRYDLSVRTLQGWEQGRTQPPSYLVGLLERLIKSEKRSDNGEEGENKERNRKITDKGEEN